METRRITLFGIPFDTVSESQALLKLHYYSQLPLGEQKICLTPNPEMVVAAATEKTFYDILRRSDFSVADGTGVLWASGFLPLSTLDFALLGQKPLKLKNLFSGLFSLLKFAFARNSFAREIKTRVTGTDLLAHFLATSQAKIFLLGGAAGAAKNLAANFPHIVGFYDSVVTLENSAEICALINSSQAEVLFVGLGSPKQEFWIAENLKQCPNIRFAMGVGGAFDFLSGVQKRAPSWLRSIGLEWLYRLIKEPHRFSRIWNATVKFFLLTVREKG